jgi:biopolymer transport protein TolR|tara:strand:- start:21123 stop:21539 length:417 start_codon:yes stop_codon:yes gene_type:complete
MIINSGNNNSRYRNRTISDINITPFVDVLLVLLIIFMVTSPIITGGLNVNLPNGVNQKDKITQDDIIVSIQKDSKIYLNDKQINISSLARDLKKSSKNDLSYKIHIKADKENDYGKVMEIVKIINLAGFSHVILVTKK